MTKEHQGRVLNLAESLAKSGAFADRWSIEKELEARGYSMVRRLFEDAKRGERLDRMCAAARKNQPVAETRAELKPSGRTYSMQPR